MLVLTRRITENRTDPRNIIILHDKRTGDTIEVQLIEVQGDQVRLGIVAPRHVTVDRSEIAQAKRQDGPRIRTAPVF